MMEEQKCFSRGGIFCGWVLPRLDDGRLNTDLFYVGSCWDLTVAQHEFRLGG